MSGFVYVCRVCQRQLRVPVFETCTTCDAVLSLTVLRRRGHLMAVQLGPPIPGTYKVEVSALRCPECDTPVQATTGEVCANCGFNFAKWADGSVFPARALGAKQMTIDSPFDIDPALQAILRACETAMKTPCPKCRGSQWDVNDVTLAPKPWKPPWFLKFLKPAPPRPSSASLTCQSCERSVHVEVPPQLAL